MFYHVWTWYTVHGKWPSFVFIVNTPTLVEPMKRDNTQREMFCASVFSLFTWLQCMKVAFKKCTYQKIIYDLCLFDLFLFFFCAQWHWTLFPTNQSFDFFIMQQRKANMRDIIMVPWQLVYVLQDSSSFAWTRTIIYSDVVDFLLF